MRDNAPLWTRVFAADLLVGFLVILVLLVSLAGNVYFIGEARGARAERMKANDAVMRQCTDERELTQVYLGQVAAYLDAQAEKYELDPPPSIPERLLQ